MKQKYLSSAERRAYAVLDAYGSQPASWPQDERQTTMDCIVRSPSLQRYQAQLEDLDARIRSAQVDAQVSVTEVQALQQRILASLPVQTITISTAVPASRWMHLVDWLIMPRHAIALAAIAILAIALVVHHPVPKVLPDKAGNAGYAAWSWYDITGQELPANRATTALTMTDFIDQEINQDGG